MNALRLRGALTQKKRREQAQAGYKEQRRRESAAGDGIGGSPDAHPWLYTRLYPEYDGVESGGPDEYEQQGEREEQ